jgi:hypothetical protein
MGYEPGAWAYSPSLATSQEDYDRGFALETLALPPLGSELSTDRADSQIIEKRTEQRSSSDEGIPTCPAHGCSLVLDLKSAEIQGTAIADHSRDGDQPTSPTSSLGRSNALSDADFEPEEFPDDIDVVIRVPDLGVRFGQLRF